MAPCLTLKTNKKSPAVFHSELQDSISDLCWTFLFFLFFFLNESGPKLPCFCFLYTLVHHCVFVCLFGFSDAIFFIIHIYIYEDVFIYQLSIEFFFKSSFLLLVHTPSPKKKGYSFLFFCCFFFSPPFLYFIFKCRLFLEKKRAFDYFLSVFLYKSIFKKKVKKKKKERGKKGGVVIRWRFVYQLFSQVFFSL